MTPSEIIQRRLSNQRLIASTFKKPIEVVRWLGAVQSQDYAGGKLALGLRLQNPSDTVIEKAFDDGEFIRLHIMRPTWHFVAPEDVRWLMDLTAHRVAAACASRHRELEMDKAIFSRANKLLTRALQGGSFLTRQELAGILGRAGINNSGERMGHLMLQAELDKVVCSGPRRGKQFTYALFDARIPASASLSREESLAEVTRRYFTSHGPATAADFVWWSGLTGADVKLGLELVKSEMVSETLDGQTYWMAPLAQSSMPKSPLVHLMPNYDEYIVGYTDRSNVYNSEHNDKLDARGNFLFNNTIVIDGRVAGIWKRTFKKDTALLEPTFFEPLTKAQTKAFETAVGNMGTFLGMKTEIRD
jgi:Winged helix DNA-binding domain